MNRARRLAVGLLALGLFVSGCYGPFHLTRRLHQWNGQVGTGKWEKEFIFIILAWTPVYGLVILGDALVFNSMEFWTGNNPVAPTAGQSVGPRTQRIVRGDAEAVMTYTPTADSATLLVQQYERGRPAGGLRLERRDGKTIGYDADGRVVFTAETLTDGQVVVSDADGHPLKRSFTN